MQRERSLCSLKIEIPTNFPTNFNFEQNLYPKTFFKLKIQNERNASKTTKIQDLGKQRERSLCSLKIETPTNFPTNCNFEQIRTPKRFSNSKIQNECNMSRTTKIQDLGKQREWSLCLRKTQNFNKLSS